MLHCQPAARNDEPDESVGQGDRDTGANGRALSRPEDDRLASHQVRAGIAGVRVAGNNARGNQNINGFSHPTRLVHREPRKVWSNERVTPYREKLWPAPWLFISTALVIPASLLVFLPINPNVGVVVAVALYAACVAALIAGSPVLEVTETEFRAGRARLPLKIVGSAAAFHGDEAQLERGQRLDARAWLLIRGWISPVVRIEVLDKTDPAPYWLVSTRRPDAVIQAIAEAKRA